MNRSRYLACWFLIGPGLFFACPTNAADCVDLRSQTHWVGALSLIGDVLDIGLGEIDYELANSGDFVYAFGNGTLQTIDFSIPAHPVVTDTLDFYAMDAVVLGNHIYFACDNAGLKIVDISDPKHPAVVSEISNRATTVRVHGDLAYITSWMSTEVIDISDPELPMPLGTMEYPTEGYPLSGLVGNIGYQDCR